VGYSIQVQGNLVAGISGYGRIIAQAGKVHCVGSIVWGQLQTRYAQPTIFVMGVGNIFSYGRSMMIQGLNSLKNWLEKTGVYMGGCKNGGQLARINK